MARKYRSDILKLAGLLQPAGIGRLTNQPGGERVIYKCVPGASWPVRSTYST